MRNDESTDLLAEIDRDLNAQADPPDPNESAVPWREHGADTTEQHSPSDSTASLAGPYSYEVCVIRPDDGQAVRWNVYATRDAADTERVKLARIGMYAIVRRIEGAP